MGTSEIGLYVKVSFSSRSGGAVGEEFACQRRRCRLDFCVWKIPLEEEIATHSCILAWKIPWTEEHGGLQSMGSQRAGYD